MSVERPLPSPSSGRWLPRTKFLVVAAVERGQLSIGEACQLYQLTTEEFFSWQNSFRRHGHDGLKATQVQKYRPTVVRRVMRRRKALTRAGDLR